MSKLQRGGGQFIKARYVQSCSTKAKPPWTINIHLIIKKKRRTDRRKKKTDLFWGRVPVGEDWTQGKGE
jgi:hypothetical protein